jgi:hypothetical protein
MVVGVERLTIAIETFVYLDALMRTLAISFLGMALVITPTAQASQVSHVIGEAWVAEPWPDVVYPGLAWATDISTALDATVVVTQQHEAAHIAPSLRVVEGGA